MPSSSVNVSEKSYQAISGKRRCNTSNCQYKLGHSINPRYLGQNRRVKNHPYQWRDI